MTPLTTPEVLGCYFDIGFMPPVAAMLLRWKDTGQPRTWRLPDGETFTAVPPSRFGIRVRRQADNAYNLTLVWDSLYRQWFSLRREELLGSAVEPVLAALGTQLSYLLEQPAGEAERSLPGAA